MNSMIFIKKTPRTRLKIGGISGMHRAKKALSMLLALTAAIVLPSLITLRQLPDELIIHQSGNSQLSTFIPVSVECGDDCAESASAKLFGIVGIKNIGIRRESPKRVMLAGTLFGLRMYSDGVMVAGLSDFISDGRRVNPARDAGISSGDIIRSVCGKEIYTNSEFVHAVEKCGGTLTAEVTDSEGRSRTVRITPAYSDADGCLKTGMWVRDSAAGLGTLTYIDPQSGSFGGLGHGICDADTHGIIPIHDGEIVSARISGVRKGVRGKAGEIRGYLSGDEIGTLQSNTICGAFGKYTAKLPELPEYESAVKQEIKQGKAKILCTVNPENETRLYDIVIEKINYSGEPAKNMIIRVTDKELLEETGGIIQGMSGSPIIQNGRFVGAVTHVFVNNPRCGYGIFAENMLEQQG